MAFVNRYSEMDMVKNLSCRVGIVMYFLIGLLLLHIQKRHGLELSLLELPCGGGCSGTCGTNTNISLVNFLTRIQQNGLMPSWVYLHKKLNPITELRTNHKQNAVLYLVTKLGAHVN